MLAKQRITLAKQRINASKATHNVSYKVNTLAVMVCSTVFFSFICLFI